MATLRTRGIRSAAQRVTGAASRCGQPGGLCEPPGSTGRHRNDTGDGQPPGLLIAMLPGWSSRHRRALPHAETYAALGVTWTRSTTGQLRITVRPGLFSEALSRLLFACPGNRA